MKSVFSGAIEQWRAAWAGVSSHKDELRLYALVDPAQDRQVIDLIASESADNECLFGYELDSPIARATPRLVLLSGSDASPLHTWLLRTMCNRPVATLMASALDLPTLAAHFRRHIDVELEGLKSMYLALWDPAILGTLLGQRDDETLHVPGPVLKPQQAHELVSPLRHWWYVDRDGELHDAASSERRTRSYQGESNLLVLDAQQTDQLVEASVPDHLLQHIRQNQPELLDRLPNNQHYRFAQQQLRRARDHGLEGTGDLVNYLCLALAFGSAFDELPSMAALLVQVKGGAMTFGDALSKVPEAELTAGMIVPVLL